MRKRELVGCSFWVAIGILFCLGAVHYGIYEGKAPGSGFLPFMGGIILILLGLATAILTLTKDFEIKVQEKDFFPERDSFRKVIFSVLALFVYGLALEYLGFLLTTFLFMIFLFRFIEPQKWSVVIAGGLLTAVVSYVLFQLLLKMQLPQGIWGL